MDGLARFSQASVIDRIGVFVRLEAIRTEKHQTRYQPLQPYMDEKSIVEHARPWKQILMFFARTQRQHEWNSPKYRFTRRQREAWEALTEQAKHQVNGEEHETEEENNGRKVTEQYPKILTAIIKVARFMVVQKALELSEPFKEDELEDNSRYDSDDSSNSGSTSHAQQPCRKGCLQFVQDMMDKFMVRGSHGPMQWMLDLRT